MTRGGVRSRVPTEADLLPDLISEVERIALTDQTAISIRDPAGTYLFVNPVWEQIAQLPRGEVLGKKLNQLGIVPADQAAVFMAEDQKLRYLHTIVVVREYEVRGEIMRIMAVRVWVRFREPDFIIEVSYPLNRIVLDPDLATKYRQSELVLGELLATRLLFLEWSR